MADTNKPKVEVGENITPQKKAPKFTKTRLRRNCMDLFGVTVSTFDGATYCLTGEYTVEEMKQHIQKWMNTQAVPAIKKEG